MNYLRRIPAILKIHPGEERLVGLLIALYFTLAMGFVFIQSMAFGVFIGEYGPQGLPYSYISIAVFASLAAFLYIKLGERVPFATALKINIACLGALSFLVWLGLKSPVAHSVAFVLPLLFQIVINLGNLAVWSLAGRLFDFRQIKRLFPLLGAGLWAANTIGGLLVSPLVNWIGAVNLLLLAVLSIGLALLVLRLITHTYLQQAVPVSQPRKFRSATKKSTGLPKDRYVTLIFAYVILWWVAFFFLDNIFYDRAAVRFPDVDQLTAFTGQLLSITGVVAFISSTFLTSRIIGRFGLRLSLLAMPLTITLALGFLAASGSLGAALAIAFVVGSLAKLINVAFGFSLSQSANAIVYQSLPDTIRPRVQATAEGVVQPIAIGIAGLSLLAFTAGLKFDYVGLSYVFLGLGAAWIFVIYLLSGNYVNALTQAITKRRFGASPDVLADPASVAILRNHLHDTHPGVALYALNKLERLDSQAISDELPRLIQHPAGEVRREAFSRIENLKLHSALAAVQNQLSAEPLPNVKEAALRALGAISDNEAAPQLTTALEKTNPHELRGALVGLLKYSGNPLAEQKLTGLLTSNFPDDRILAAQVLGELERDSFQDAHRALLRDADTRVRVESLAAVGKIRQRSLYPDVIQACDVPGTSRAAGLALASIGTAALPEIESAFSNPEATRQRLLTLSKALGQIGGAQAHAILLTRMDTPDSEVRLQILNALSQSGYQTQDMAAITHAIQAESKQAAWVCSAQVALGDRNETALLYAALNHFLTRSRERVLLLLSFAYDADSILKVREAFLTGSAAQRSYALEIIDTQLPSELKLVVMPLLEDLSPQERLQRYANLYPQSQESSADYLRKLIEGQGFTIWIRACAIYTALQIPERTCFEAVESLLLTEPDSLLGETARWALSRVESDSVKGSSVMLSTIEKVIILKTVDMFSQTPDDVLADVAGLLEEVDADEGEEIFQQGDLGDSMYVIVDGKVSVHDGERLLNYLGERNVFGEMALLDPEPRMASVTAVEPTRLFRLEQTPFYELISQRPEVATGIIRVLTGHLRNRVRDIAQLDARVKELESETHTR